MFEELEIAYGKQRAAFFREPFIPISRRKKQLKKIRDLLIKRKEALRSAISDDFGKPAFETDSSEFLVTIREIDRLIKNIYYWNSARRVGTELLLTGTSSWIRIEPKGVVLILAPWNYPLNLTLVPLCAAIAGGNRVFVKPSEMAPGTAGFIQSLMQDVFTEEEVICTQGGPELGAFLCQLGFDHIYFTGSKRVGVKVMQEASSVLSPVTLELGGKNPAILDHGVSLKDAVERILFSKYLNAGQTCIATDYLIIPEKLVDDFVDLWLKKCSEWFPGDLSECTNYCGIINLDHFNRILSLIHTSISQGASSPVAIQSDENSLRIKPVLLLNSRFDHASMQDEIFGPVLPVITYKENVEEVLPGIKKIDRPLTLYIFSLRNSFHKWVLDQVRSGGATINNTLLNYCEPNLPFGGDHHSGHGSTMGYFGFRTFVHERAVARQGRLFNALSFFYPPYTKFSHRLLNWTSKLYS